MIIMLLILALSMSKDSKDDSNMLKNERPSADIVRQIDYMQRILSKQSNNVSNFKSDGIENGRLGKAKMMKISNDLSIKNKDILRKYIVNKTVGLCDFTCKDCYRCSLVYGNLNRNNEDEALFYE